MLNETYLHSYRCRSEHFVRSFVHYLLSKFPWLARCQTGHYLELTDPDSNLARSHFLPEKESNLKNLSVNKNLMSSLPQQLVLVAFLRLLLPLRQQLLQHPHR